MTSHPRHGRSVPRQSPGHVEPVSGDGDPGHAANESRGAGAPRHNLPFTPSSFVGREADLEQVTALLSRSRLVTLTGAGGMGKTRLALRVAHGAASEYPEGVWLAELAPLSDSALLPDVITGVVPGRLRHGGPRSAQQLVAQIGERSLLLVVDNCEHLIGPCANLVDALLRFCPSLSVLATSREPLGVGGEHTWPLGPLSLPRPGVVDAESVSESEAGELFIQRAKAISPSFELSESVAPAVAELCRRLDGMPLAIELAAARLVSLSALELLERLDDGFGLLTTGSRSVMPRHQRLAATLEWSHDLLSPPEATLLRRVSVFAGWTLEAAEEVCAGGEVDRAEVVDHLTALVGKSLVVATTRGGHTRYFLLETIRAWARTKLEAASENADRSRRHASWCLELAEQGWMALQGEAAEAWFDRLETEHDNFRAALEWARASADVELGARLATALTTFWRLRGHHREGLGWLEWAIAAEEDCPIPLRAGALREAGLLRGMLGEITAAIQLLEASSALLAQCGDDGASVYTCNPFLIFRDPRGSLPGLEEKVALCRATGDTNKLAHFLWTLGHAHFLLGEVADARRHFDECVQLGRGASDGLALRSGLFGLGRVALFCGEHRMAEASIAEAHGLAQKMGDLDDLTTALGLSGDLARARGDWEDARDRLDESLRLARSRGLPLCLARALYFRARLADAQSDGDDAGSAKAYAEALSLGRAVGAPGFHEARCLLGLGSAAEANGDVSAAAGRFLEALGIAQAIGDTQAGAHALDRLSGLARLDGRSDEAYSLAHRALAARHHMGELPAITASLESVGGLAVDGERWELAARLLGAAQAVRDEGGYARSRAEQARLDADLDQARSALGKDAFSQAWTEGTGLSADEAVAYASRMRGERGRPPSGWDSLTPAERNVARLVGEGLSNPEVGRRLFISPRTVGHHLNRVYRKIGVHSRGALMKELAGQDD